MLGNEENARFIRDWYLDVMREYYSGDNDRRREAPEGWRRLGAGCYRQVYLHVETSVVYKVEHNYRDGWQSNKGEAQNIRKLMFTRLPKGCRLPRYQLFRLDGKAVIAMEYFEKLLREFSMYGDSGRDYWTAKTEMLNAVNLSDMHASNVAVDEINKQIVPIDLGA
jgi:hypothetical protein